ncbi:MAG: hypothetical protein LBE56_10390 [Tannerella sp.]|jgi:hypothetical protein|nr:hypothetical protein [Tannerella sp.]
MKDKAMQKKSFLITTDNVEFHAADMGRWLSVMPIFVRSSGWRISIN